MKILMLDIETAPSKVYAWGLWNQNISINQIVEPGYTMCWAAKWLGKPKVLFDSIYKSKPDKMLKEIHTLMSEADAIIHYNGNKFDIPTLNREFALYGMMPPSPSHHIDLLKTMRNRFRFPSNKLDYVAQQFELGGKTAHKGMMMWEQCMNMEEKAWKKMEQYNKQDVKLLEKLYKKVLPWIKDHPNHALYTDSNRPVCTNCGSVHVIKCGTETTKTQMYQRYRCKSCGTPIRGRTTILQREKSKNILTQSKL